MPVTNAYVKFSELPDAAKVASNDQIAVLDVSEGVLCKTSVAHASTATTYGVGNKTTYGHVKVLDAPASTVFNAGEALAASKGKEIIDHLTASNNTPFRFGYNSATGEYGYILKQGGADTVIPFKTKHTGTYIATARKTNNDMGETHTYRYVDTTGVPNANSGTYPATVRKANNDMGATNTYRYVDTTGVPNANSGTYPATARSASIDMGATNTYRYVNTEGVPAKGESVLPSSLTMTFHAHVTCDNAAQDHPEIDALNTVYVPTAGVYTKISMALGQGYEHLHPDDTQVSVVGYDINGNATTVVPSTYQAFTNVDISPYIYLQLYVGQDWEDSNETRVITVTIAK